MPVHLPPGLISFREDQFKQIAYEVMDVVFAVHNEMGCLFDEVVYKRAVLERTPQAQTEVPIRVFFDTFHKTYYLDLLVAGGAAFEFKAAERIVERHRAQTINYLLLAELPHGKLVNFAGDLVEHEFINTTLTRRQRTVFQVDDHAYSETPGAPRDLRDLLVPILRDWGTCLDIVLYQEAVIHFLGGAQQDVMQPVLVYVSEKAVGHQKLILLSQSTSVCISVLNDGQNHYEANLRRLLKHTHLEAIQWVNIGRKLVTFKTLKH